MPFTLPVLAGAHAVSPAFQRFTEVFRCQRVGPAKFLYLLDRHSQLAEERRTDIRIATLGIAYPRAKGSGLHQEPETLFAFPQGILRPLALGDVHVDTKDAADL